MGGSPFYEVISQKIFFFTIDGFPNLLCNPFFLIRTLVLNGTKSKFVDLIWRTAWYIIISSQSTAYSLLFRIKTEQHSFPEIQLFPNQGRENKYRVITCFLFNSLFLLRFSSSLSDIFPPLGLLTGFLDALASLRPMMEIKWVINWFTFLRLLQLEPSIVPNC